jgi:isorenieratene synthase
MGWSAPWVALGVSVLAVGWFVRWLRLPKAERSWFGFRSLLARLIRRGFGGYKQPFNTPDDRLPEPLVRTRRVLVIGAGLAGISSASKLASCGFQVTLRDANPYLGGKVGAWNVETKDGTQLEVDHGFHAFFRHYYNLRCFLEDTGVSANLVPIDDYVILERGDGVKPGRAWSFRDVETSPVLNLIALAKGGLYRWRDILLGPALHKM